MYLWGFVNSSHRVHHAPIKKFALHTGSSGGILMGRWEGVMNIYGTLVVWGTWFPKKIFLLFWDFHITCLFFIPGSTGTKAISKNMTQQLWTILFLLTIFCVFPFHGMFNCFHSHAYFTWTSNFKLNMAVALTIFQFQGSSGAFIICHLRCDFFWKPLRKMFFTFLGRVDQN